MIHKDLLMVFNHRFKRIGILEGVDEKKLKEIAAGKYD